MKILVAYATSQGSTKTIAERIKQRITATWGGSENTTAPEVDVKAVSPDLPVTLPDYDALVVGAPLHAGSWMRPGRRFLNEAGAVLKHDPRPVWAFTVGLPLEEKKVEGAAAEGDAAKKKPSMFEKEKADAEKAIRAALPAPTATGGNDLLRGHELFMGRWIFSGNWKWLKPLLAPLGVKEQDRRDFDAIDRWADKIVADLKGPAPATAEAQPAAAQ